jgi:hypothetical protein
MVLHHLFYQLALLAVIWLFVMLHLTGAKPGRPAPPVSAQPKRKRSTKPKAFEGLTKKPHCALCEQEIGETPSAPPRRPDPMPPTAAPARWTPRCTFAPTPIVIIAVG